MLLYFWASLDFMLKCCTCLIISISHYPLVDHCKLGGIPLSPSLYFWQTYRFTELISCNLQVGRRHIDFWKQNLIMQQNSILIFNKLIKILGYSTWWLLIGCWLLTPAFCQSNIDLYGIMSCCLWCLYCIIISTCSASVKHLIFLFIAENIFVHFLLTIFEVHVFIIIIIIHMFNVNCCIVHRKCQKKRKTIIIINNNK